MLILQFWMLNLSRLLAVTLFTELTLQLPVWCCVTLTAIFLWLWWWWVLPDSVCLFEKLRMCICNGYFVCKVCLMDILNCYIDGKLLICGHGYRVLDLWSSIIRISGCARCCAVSFLVIMVVKQVQLGSNQIVWYRCLRFKGNPIWNAPNLFAAALVPALPHPNLAFISLTSYYNYPCS